MLSSILYGSSYLTVLELQDSEITQVPATIGNLCNLRYIGLRRTKVKSLPGSVEKLSNLQTLDIRQTHIESLPQGITKIKKLRHLLADRYADEKHSEFRFFIGMQAPKDMSNLKELQTLETMEASKDLAKQLKELIQLQSVWIDGISSVDCQNIFDSLSKMPLLSSLLLSARDQNERLCFEAFKPISTQLHRLIIRGKWATGTMDCPIFRTHGTCVKYLALSWCDLGDDPLRMLALLHLPNLTHLRLSNMHNAKKLVLYAENFFRLKSLVLKDMPHVNQINIIGGSLSCIEALYILALPNLDKVPLGIESILSLKKLWLLGLHMDFRKQWNNSGMHQKMQHIPESFMSLNARSDVHHLLLSTMGMSSVSQEDLGHQKWTITCKHGILEDKLEAPRATPMYAVPSEFSKTVEPTDLKHEFLKEITNNFSKEQILGQGAFGTVYRGLHKNGEEIAVKVLRVVLDPERGEEQFQSTWKLEKQTAAEMEWFLARRVLPTSKEMHPDSIELRGS
ncbi:Os11g0228800 [Oryza sativa Japonica Group]|uniref:Os11g0228800 protein n=1 Tax=Oryza sativa subsp. japonica TaxID=39947 RepID=A0A0P0Y1B9_ORYSJ|nr:Os11g0228800 [Oryza sativa Japonica Group]